MARGHRGEPEDLGALHAAIEAGEVKMADLRLAGSLADLSHEDLEGSDRRTARIALRVTPEEHEQIKSLSAELGTSVSEYLLRLHRVAQKRLNGL